jgi:uncharacterized iron-regulated protein
MGTSRPFPPLALGVAAALVVLPVGSAAQSTDPPEVEQPPLPDDPLTEAQFFTGDGHPATLDDVLAAARAGDVLFLGEFHTDRLAHALQFRIFRDLVEHQDPGDAPPRPLILSLEMFETDVQTVLDEYLAGFIREDHFLAASRPWRHYASDYRPLVELARERGIPVVAANAPRRYVSRVTREGPESLEDLPATAKAFLPPLPYQGPSPAYLEELRAVFASHGGEGSTESLPGNAVYSQALWDAGMAWSLASALQARPGALAVHLTGSFHVRNRTGLPEHLDRYRPGTRMVTVIMEPSEERSRVPDELLGTGDFLVLTNPRWSRPSPVPGS